MTFSLEERFWAKVEKTDGCWNWRGAKNAAGYGSLRTPDGTKYAHRTSFALANGDVPLGLQVCHRCDNPSCVRPEHLFLGTAKANSDDKRQKERHARGERSGTKLTRELVIAIRGRLKEGAAQTRVAVEFGVTQSHVSAVKRRAVWAHVP